MEIEYKKRYYLLLLPEVILVVYVAVKKLFFRLLGKKPKYNTWWYDRLAACQEIRQTAEKGQTALSLNVVYNYYNQPNGYARNFTGWMEKTWMEMPAAQAVRNRKAIVTRLMEAEVRKAWNEHPNEAINAVFFAGGFVETGIAVAKAVQQDGIVMNCVVLDISRQALDQARRRAEEAGVADSFSFIRINLLNTARVRASLSDMNVQIVEMIGILDYLSEEEAIQLFRLIRSILTPAGLLLTGNILPRVWESAFLYTVINWPAMKHRTTGEFYRLLQKAGMIAVPGDARLYVEPHKVFAVFEVRNTVAFSAAATAHAPLTMPLTAII